MSKRFCLRGHDTAVVGRNKDRACRQCRREDDQRPEAKEYQRNYKRKYWQRPEVKARQREHMRKYSQRPEIQERHRELLSLDRAANPFRYAIYKAREQLKKARETRDEQENSATDGEVGRSVASPG